MEDIMMPEQELARGADPCPHLPRRVCPQP